MATPDGEKTQTDDSAPTVKPWLKHYESSVPPTISYPDIPIHQFLRDSAAKFPGNPAAVYFGRTITYAELSSRVDRFAAALSDLGVKKGDRVALFLPNCPQNVIAYYGALQIGAIVVPTNPLYVEAELEHQLVDSGAETIVTLTKFYPLVKKVRPRTSLKHVIVTNIKEFFPPVLRLLFTLLKESKDGHRVQIDQGPGTHSFSSLLMHQANSTQVSIHPDDIALFQYTGGTTGVSKGAMLSHRNIVSNTIQVGRWLSDVKPGQEIVLSVLPFFHVYGMTVAMNFAVYSGAAMVLIPRFDVEEVLKAIVKQKPTVFPGVPTIYGAINNYAEVGKYDLRSIRACISGAAPLPVETQSVFERLTGARLVEGYGLTEAAPVTHCNPVFGLRKAGSIGVPFPDVDAKIVDQDDWAKELSVGEIGELAVHGPQVMRGYWNMPQETESVLKGDWLLTGDIARMDEDGYFYIVDRKKDLIIAGGYNIYPRDIEEVLYTHPKIKEAVAVGVPDEYRGETVKVFCVLKEGQTATAEEVINFCKDKMAKYKVPTQVEFRPELPKTLVGKFLRRVLLEEEMKKRASGAQSPTLSPRSESQQS
ncbi:MAG: long-chain fatty acid--CoA ligase [Chloroflexi bacterium]|nr:long-chain fatty acid--CoA ligase [Chloroflexota bacterium]